MSPENTIPSRGHEPEGAAFGEFLRAARERRRVSLEKISGETKIAPRHLEALERGDVRSWPRGMYRRAMMRAYAESVGLDQEFALEQFERAFDQPATPRPAPAPAAEAQPAARRPLKVVVRRALMALLRPAVISVVRPAAAAIAVVAIVTIAWSSIRGGSMVPAQMAHAEAALTSRIVPISTAALPPEIATTSIASAAAEVASPAPKPPVTEGRLVVASHPPGARVTVNGIGWGTTPLTIRYLPFGDKRVRVTMIGYVSAERVLRLGAERPNASVRMTLKARN